MSTEDAKPLNVVERRALLDLFAELASVDPEEHPQGKPYYLPLIRTELSGLRKVLAKVLTEAV